MPDTGTVATPVPVPEPTPVKRTGKAAELIPSPLLALFYLDVPYDEASWPRIDIGDPPYLIEKLDGVWVEEYDKNEAINIVDLTDEAQRKWEEINSDSTVEQSEEIAVQKVFGPTLGSIVRNFTFTWGEGGSNPTVKLSGSILASRKDPLLRVATVVQDQVAKSKSDSKEVS